MHINRLSALLLQLKTYRFIELTYQIIIIIFTCFTQTHYVCYALPLNIEYTAYLSFCAVHYIASLPYHQYPQHNFSFNPIQLPIFFYRSVGSSRAFWISAAVVIFFSTKSQYVRKFIKAQRTQVQKNKITLTLSILMKISPIKMSHALLLIHHAISQV